MVTMQDVADRANVSRGTVSYVLNGKHKKAKISEATKDKVLKSADALKFRRNAIAQSMKTGKTNVIGVIGGLYHSYCMKIIKGINQVIAKNDYMIKLFPTETKEELENAVRQCVEQRLAGVICRSLTGEELIVLRNELEPNNIPVVLVDGSFSDDWCSRVTSDDFAGAMLATEYLLKMGHRKIVHVTNSLDHGYANIRYQGYKQMMSDWGCEATGDDVCIVDDEIKLDDQYNKLRTFLRNSSATALFCSSDPLAMKVIAATMSKIKIPHDLSIIGFADLNYSAFTAPALTTVRQPFVEMGASAAEVLLSAIKNESKAKEIKLPVELVIRASVSAPNRVAPEG